MSRNYDGMCVGGPLAGQFLSYVAPFYRVALRREIPPLNDLFIQASAEIEMKTHTYRHVVGLRVGEYSVDFWIEEGKTVEDVINTVFGFYAKNVSNKHLKAGRG